MDDLYTVLLKNRYSDVSGIQMFKKLPDFFVACAAKDLVSSCHLPRLHLLSRHCPSPGPDKQH